MVEPIQGLPSNVINRLTSAFGPDAVQSFLSHIEQGVPVGQAFSMAFGNDVRHAGDMDVDGLTRALADLPQEVQQRIAQGADALPPPVREALDQLGITQPEQRGHGNENAAAARDAIGGPRGDGGAANQVTQAFGAAEARAANVSGQVGNAFAAQEAAPRGGFAQVGPAQQADRAFNDAALVQQQGRAGEGFAAGRTVDPGQAVVMADRTNAAQQQLPAQAVPTSPGRADALAAQAAMPALAGATMLANPQVNPLPGQVAAPLPPGTDAAAAQAREAQLAPAGHTIAGFLRRDLRRGSVQPPRDRPPGALLALIADRRKRREDDEDGASSFQWLFWILTIVAYGALAVAVVAMIPSGGGLIDGYGRPTYGAYALVVGAIAAVVSWFIGRKLSKHS